MTEVIVNKLTEDEFNQWISAMQSGRYKQCHKYLEFGIYNCALGVLAVELDLRLPDGELVSPDLVPSVIPRMTAKDVNCIINVNDLNPLDNYATVISYLLGHKRDFVAEEMQEDKCGNIN